jgi:hypothetical protein
MSNKFFTGLGAISLAVVVVMIWRDQSVAAETLGDVFGWVGGFVTEAIDKLSEFLGNL